MSVAVPDRATNGIDSFPERSRAPKPGTTLGTPAWSIIPWIVRGLAAKGHVDEIIRDSTALDPSLDFSRKAHRSNNNHSGFTGSKGRGIFVTAGSCQ